MKQMKTQEKDMAGLFSGFLSGTLTSKEKSDLYNYMVDNSHKEEIFLWLHEQWGKELLQADIEIASEALLERIKADIGKGKRNHRINTFLRYAAIFIIGFGLSWVVQKNTNKIAGVRLVAEVSQQYNEVLVPYGSKTKVVLPDNSTVWLNSGARLKYPVNFDGDQRIVNLQGEGFFDVTKDSDHPFLVNSNGLNIKVLGTKFNLMANADDPFIETTLVEGALEILGVKDAGKRNNVVLQPGQKLTLRKENNQYIVNNIQEAGLTIPEETIKPVKIERTDLIKKANVELATAWTENKMVFARERFGEVKVKLERWYGVTIEVKDPDILDYRFTGTFEKQTFEQAMNALSKAASCKFKIDKNHVIISK